MRLSRSGAVAWMRALAVVAALFAARTAAAYPEFQFSTGASRCAECHFSPVGGGLINDYGRDEAASTISEAGDGRFLHGLVELPAWLALGGDVRIAALGKHVRGGTEAAVFPMQADLYARVGTDRWSALATFGILETIRRPQPLLDRIGSREHFVMYEEASKAWYARAGRFLPVFGLRMPDHTAYVRRYTGLHSLEERYAVGGGRVEGRWEVHATVMTPLELHPQVGRPGWGAAVLAERRNAEDTGSWAAHAKGQHVDGGIDGWLGASYKRWIEAHQLWLAAEVDLGAVVIAGAPAIGRAVAYGAVHYRPAKRWGAALGAHLFDADLRLADNERIAIEARGSWFPRAHVELAALIRGSVTARELGRGDALGFLQLHYYL